MNKHITPNIVHAVDAALSTESVKNVWDAQIPKTKHWKLIVMTWLYGASYTQLSKRTGISKRRIKKMITQHILPNMPTTDNASPCVIY